MHEREPVGFGGNSFPCCTQPRHTASEEMLKSLTFAGLDDPSQVVPRLGFLSEPRKMAADS